MTREEAIKVLEHKFELSCRNNLFQNAEKLDYEDALWIAIAALRPVSREQVEKVWRGEWMLPIFTSQNDANDSRCQCSECGNIETPLARYRFCPNCGAPMTDDAVSIVMEKLEVLKTDAP